jgi:hypothetical protein
MSWLNKVKDHVGSGIASTSNLNNSVSSGTLSVGGGGGGAGTYPMPLLNKAEEDALTGAEIMRRVQAHNLMMNTPSVYATTSTRQWSSREKILMRLDMPDGYHIGFHHLDAVRLNDEKMVIFVVTDGKHCTIEDDAHLFPSDTLITQLRILRK